MCPMHGVDVGHPSLSDKGFRLVYGAVEKTRKCSEKAGFPGFLCPTHLQRMALCIKGLVGRCPTPVGEMFHSFQRLWTTALRAQQEAGDR